MALFKSPEDKEAERAAKEADKAAKDAAKEAEKAATAARQAQEREERREAAVKERARVAALGTWEYAFDVIVKGAKGAVAPDEVRKKLNERGAEGWQLVTVENGLDLFMARDGLGLFFRRPLSPAAGAN